MKTDKKYLMSTGDILQGNLQYYDPGNEIHVKGNLTTPPICMIASDVIAMFPNLDKKEVSKICRIMIENSQINFEGIDVNEMLLYVRLNLDHCSDVAPLVPFLPQRKYTKGDTPGMSSDSNKCPHKQS